MSERVIILVSVLAFLAVLILGFATIYAFRPDVPAAAPKTAATDPAIPMEEPTTAPAEQRDREIEPSPRIRAQPNDAAADASAPSEVAQSTPGTDATVEHRVYEGRTLEEWRELATSEESKEREDVAWALGKIDVDERDLALVLKLLTELAQDPDENVRTLATTSLSKHGEAGVRRLVELLKREPDQVQTTLLAALAQAGDTAVPYLIDALNSHHREEGLGAVAALAAIGEPAVPALVEATKGKGPRPSHLCGMALMTLGEIGREARSALPVVGENLNDSDPRVRKAAAYALERMEGGSDQ
ncbi:MAG: HEAT repeat domain-containing protein [bacterium]